METHNSHLSLAPRGWVPDEARLASVSPLKAIRSRAGFALLALALITICLHLLNPRERVSEAPIVRNTAWNDFIRQIASRGDSPPHESLGRDLLLIQKFLKEHEFDERVGIYDPAVLRAIDHARARLQKADKDLQRIRTELSYQQFEGGRGEY